VTTNYKATNANRFLLLMLLAGFALTIFLFNPPQPSLAQRGIPDSDGNGEKISPELQKAQTQSLTKWCSFWLSSTINPAANSAPS
jgi:hypothetical protein